MDDRTERNDTSDVVWAPGTITLEDRERPQNYANMSLTLMVLVHRSGDQIILHPPPSSDPNDPLVWTQPVCVRSLD